jgi:glycosyltransferase involved in cell wall biosynthesis
MLSIIVPVYNEENTIIEVLNRLLNLKIEKEIVVVNDGSTDTTKDKLDRLNPDLNIKAISLKDNKGKGSAIREWLRAVSGDVVVIQDADSEYDPADLIKLLGILKEGGFEAVYGDRFSAYCNTPLWHMVGNRILSIFSSLFYFCWIRDIETCYKMMYRSNWLDLDLRSERFEIEAEITAKLIRKRFKLAQHPIKYNFRSYKEGKKISYKDGLRSLYILFKYRFQN